MHAIMVSRCTLKDKIHICVLCLLFCSLVKVMCEYTRLPAMLWGGGGEGKKSYINRAAEVLVF